MGMTSGTPCASTVRKEPGRTSWTAVLDAVRLGPDDDEAEVTAAQVRDVITRLVTAGHWREGDRPILVIFDAGYDPMRLACRLADLPVEVVGGCAATGSCASRRSASLAGAGHPGTGRNSSSLTRRPGPRRR